MAWIERQQRAMEEMGGAFHKIKGGLRVHEVDLRQSLPTVLKAIEIKFGKLDASLMEVVTEIRRLGRESVGRGEQS